MAEEDTKKAPKKKARPAHPPAVVMVTTAIKIQKKRKGSSLQAIKRYIAANYNNIDMDRQKHFIKRALKKEVARGNLIQIKGRGAAGSFKLNATAVKKEAAQKVKREKAKAKRAAEREEAAAKARAQKEKKKKSAAAEEKPKRSNF